ncbi:MAG: putative Ig domain-containing protein [Bacteroidetes bacterium]|nr:putative Ig domain-containing protein [Bacteroidota bacterium]
MKKLALTSALLLIFGIIATSQPIPPDSLYLGQIPPGSQRKIFNLFADPGYYAVEKIAVSPDGKEIYYEETNSIWISYKFKYYKYYNDKWNGPVNLFTGYYCLSISPDGNSMYFENNNYNDCWISDKQGAAWNPPVRFLENFNVHSLNYTNLGNYYLSSNPAGCLGQRDVCKLITENSDTSVAGLGLPVNSSANEGDFFISIDESFMIVMSDKSGGYGSTDLYISYRKSNDHWTNPKNLGTSVNTSGDDFGPYVTTDNKYLFYESGYSSPSSIYWVQVDQLIDSLRFTNFLPYVRNQVPDQTAVIRQSFNFTLPDSTFIDDDGNNTLTYSAKLTNGNPLPAWLTFDTLAGTFIGTPEIIETLNIRVTATDTAGAAASTSFKIMVKYPVSIDQVYGQPEWVRIFPNPTDGLINISLGELSGKTAKIEIRNPEGEVILKSTFLNSILLSFTDKPKGLYLAKVSFENCMIIRKFIVE